MPILIVQFSSCQMVIIAMNPKLQISTDDIGRVWAVLNPQQKPWITFIE